MSTNQVRGQPRTQTLTRDGIDYSVRIWTDTPGIDAGGQIELRRRDGTAAWTFAVIDRETAAYRSTTTVEDAALDPQIPQRVRGVLRELGFTTVRRGDNE
ncbi:hypothetical protein [Salinirussus salinus]|uniref:hypothetical protein n=1 Tax=Salinirussus salinus TaxID=1198300 RepID=UPI001357CBC1|nr:hypothetical protein [Salinirussus salinus]